MDLKDLKIERKPAAKRRRRNPWPTRTVALVLLLGTGWALWPTASQFLDKVRLPQVRTWLVTEATTSSVAAVQGTAANGYVVAARRAALSSDVPGRIIELNVEEGSIVKKGDIVARLFADEYRGAWLRAKADHAAATTAIKRAEAALDVSRAEVEQAISACASADAQREEGRLLLDFADKELKRIQQLATTGIEGPRSKQLAERDRNTALVRLDSLAAAIGSAKAMLTTAKQKARVAAIDVDAAINREAAALATREQARATLDKTDVRAPFDGIIVLKDAEVGEVVSPNVQGGSTARGAVCTLVDFSSLEVQAHVPETSLRTVRLGAPVDVFLDAHPNRRLTGVVDRIWPTADRAKATVEVRIVLDDKTLLRPEYGVRVVFRDADSRDSELAAHAIEASSVESTVLLVPEEAIVMIDGVTTVFVVERDRVRATQVSVGQRKKRRATIRSGLAAGQRIVVAPPATLNSGDRIRLSIDPDKP